MRIPLIAALAAAAWWVHVGCYSFSGSTLPGHLRTIRINPVENRTLESALADRITQGLEDGFRRRTNLRKVSEGADCELSAVLTGYDHRHLATSGERVTSYRVDILMQVLFLDRVKGDTLYSGESVPGYGEYRVGEGETEEDGKQRAVESAVKVLLDNTVSRW